MFEYTVVEVSEQIRSLPPLFFVWLRVLAITNMASVFLLRRAEARWVLGAMLFIAATNIPIFLSLGLVKLGSIPHLIVWIPLVAHLARQLRSGQVALRTPFGMWCFAVMLLDLVSVVFDVRDGAQYLLGDRGPMPPDPSTGLPILTLVAIGASLVAISAYSLGFPRRSPRTAV